jgi:hypothetical protein
MVKMATMTTRVRKMIRSISIGSGLLVLLDTIGHLRALSIAQAAERGKTGQPRRTAISLTVDRLLNAPKSELGD